MSGSAGALYGMVYYVDRAGRLMVAHTSHGRPASSGEPLSIVLVVGPSCCQIYNDALRPILVEKHPKSTGQPAAEYWSEIWHIIGPLIETPSQGGDPTWMEDLRATQAQLCDALAACVELKPIYRHRPSH